MKQKYEHSDISDKWLLTSKKYENGDAVRKAYANQAKSMKYEIIELKPQEQFQFSFNDERQ